MGRSFTYLSVVSSTAIIPARAPASIAILQSVIRPSIESEVTADPANSTAHPVAPAVPISPMTASAKSFALTPTWTSPSSDTLKFDIFLVKRHCVASTCSTSDVPIPCARAPKAPWVDVCESPQTIVIPGSVAPCSGPITCTMPCLWSARSISGILKSLQLSLSVSNCKRLVASATPEYPARARSFGSVETLWSGTATLACSLLGCRPARRKPSNACGDVTS